MKLQTLLLSLFCLIAGCDAQKAAAVNIVKSQLIDDNGVRFRNTKMVTIKTIRGGRVTSLCGEINAHNQLGGYTGWQLFLLTTSNQFGHPPPVDASHYGENKLNSFMNDPKEDCGNIEYWHTLCDKNGNLRDDDAIYKLYPNLC